MQNIRRLLDNLLPGFRNSLNDRIIRKNLTYLSKNALMNITRTIQSIEKQGKPGIFVEAGCALGGSTICIGHAKSRKRVLKVYDVFGTIPPPSDKDDKDVHARYAVIQSGNSKGIGTDQYYGYVHDLLHTVKENLRDFGLREEDNIELIQGLYEKTMVIREPVAFAHIDCDWYSSTLTCLECIEPNLIPGGVIIVDDYYSWSGCRKAVDNYFARNGIRERYEFSTECQKLILRRCG